MALTRDILKSFKFSNIFNFTKISTNGCIQTSPFLISVRTTKHWDPKWKWLRTKKFLPVELPDPKQSDKERFRSVLKQHGIMPHRFWKNRPMTITSLTEIVDPYVPKSGDGKVSYLSKAYVKNLTDSITQKKNSFQAIKKIKSYDKSFDTKIFPQHAHDIYVKAHTVLMNKDPEELSEYTTEKANLEMLENLKYKTLRWKFLESLEPPVVVQARVAPALNNTNLFAQLTVRFHTKQMLAIYDKFGRLFYGSEVVPKDVLEYVIFEKHIVNEYGVWRLHGKIIPEWMPAGEPVPRTYKVEEEIVEDLDEMIEEDQNPEEDLSEIEIVEKEKADSSASVR